MMITQKIPTDIDAGLAAAYNRDRVLAHQLDLPMTYGILRGYEFGEGYLEMTYEVFQCPKCGRRSGHKDDIENNYCGACHEFMPADTPYEVQLEDAIEVLWPHLDYLGVRDMDGQLRTFIGEVLERRKADPDRGNVWH